MTAATKESSVIRLGSSLDLDTFPWPEMELNRRRFLEALVQLPSRTLIQNVETVSHLLRIGPHVMPLTVNETEYENSWVCSPYNGTITYPQDELQILKNRVLRTALSGLIHTVAPLLKASQINRVVCVNNWLLSTNLYPDWSGSTLDELTSEIIRRWPEHAVMFRSLNPVTNNALLKRLGEAGYLLAPSRQIYLCQDLSAAAAKQNSEIDRRLLKRCKSCRVVRDDNFSEADIPRIRELYDQLYLQKYSVHNPQFTDELIRLWMQMRVLRFIGLRMDDRKLAGIVGCFSMNNVVTTPLIGYDLSLPRELGLYRMLTALVFQLAHETGHVLNLSAGAAAFKRHRGGEPQLEYSAIYVRHLTIRRRFMWKSLSVLLKSVGASVLQKYEL